MIRNLKEFGLIAILAIVGLFAYSPVYAQSLRDDRKLLVERNDLREELRDKIASKAGIFRKIARGHAAIRNGKLTAINGTTLTVDNDGKSYSVLTGTFDMCTTQFRRRFWGVSSISEMTVGDNVNVVGRWKDDTKTTVEACLVRDTSIQKRHGVFFGTVTSLSGSGFVIEAVRRGTQTVTTSSSTKFVNRKNQSIAQGDIAVGHKVRVRGIWNNLNNTITEVTHVKDFNLPVVTSPTPTPTL